MMNFSFRRVVFAIIPLFFLAYLISCNPKKTANVVLDVAQKPFQILSEYNFFSGLMSDLKPNARVIPYDLNTPLFTDYAWKARFMYVPEGKTVEYDTAKVLQLPIGSCLIKSFYYPKDFREKAGSPKRILETRLLVHRAEGWEALDYIWNDEQTEATLENAGDIKKVSWIHYDGSKRECEYIIPNKNQCKGCHWNNGSFITPIGPKVRNLNRDLDFDGVSENILTHLTKIGVLVHGPASADMAPRLANWDDSVHCSVNDRARAYLEVNCSHCHNAKGPAYTSGLLLNLENTNQQNLGICKSPVAAGKGTGNRLVDINPGSPDKSIMIYRMASVEAGIKMPELGRGLVHKEGLDLITKWIAEMAPSDCKAN
jgi:uncharacterized repeat protein (TIGR03806 family)